MHTRIAPTPSGYLHRGNACSFLLTQHLTKLYGGTLRLRIDDIDNDRTRQEYLNDIFEVLHRLEIEYDYGPKNVYDFQEHYTQHLRLFLYEALLQDLCDTGLVYACSCSRKLLQENNGQCYCSEKSLPLDTSNAIWRMHIPDDTIIEIEDDKLGKQQIELAKVLPQPVVRKKDGLPSYQIASLSDDLHYGTDYIVRGHDLLSSSAVQLYIAQVTGKKEFLKTRFFHHPLLTAPEGGKLSKSTGAAAIKTALLQKENLQELLAIVKQWLQ